ncbi:MAG: helix-turn-helix transcriptional regulator [Leptospiraceae bacterium]|nr:helix-turn-helix transcriptional regulator [Leptospiraceae bacterium]
MIPLISLKKNQDIGNLIQFWRKLNRISQMDLALNVGISSKHLSFIETGKSKPSRDLIVRISNTLKLSLRHRNAFLRAAGFSAEFSEEPLSSSKLATVHQAIQSILTKHEPFPGIVVDQKYNILLKNNGFEKMIEKFLGPNNRNKYNNSFKILFAKDGLRNYTQNWNFIEQFLLSRLMNEIIETQNNDLVKLYNEITQVKNKTTSFSLQMDASLPYINLSFKKENTIANFFTMITTLGTALDLTVQELRVELFYPSDEATKKLFYE